MKCKKCGLEIDEKGNALIGGALCGIGVHSIPPTELELLIYDLLQRYEMIDIQMEIWKHARIN